jgi:hypothetical protein
VAHHFDDLDEVDRFLDSALATPVIALEAILFLNISVSS